jgi:uncharacterized protein with PQ loop repeat
MSQLLGFIGTALVFAGYVPQIEHLIKEHCSAGISIRAYALWCSASLLVLIHATMTKDAVFVCVQFVNLTAGCLILFFARVYEGQVCETHLRNKSPESVKRHEAPGLSKILRRVLFCSGFDVTTGQVSKPPAVQPVQSYRARLEMGAVQVEI